MNFEFNNFTPQLVAQLFIATSTDKENDEVFSKDFYNAIFSTALVLKALQHLPGEKKSVDELDCVPFSLEGVYKILEDEGYLINLVIDDFTDISNKYSKNGTLEHYTNKKVAEYMTDKLIDAVEYLKFHIILNPAKHNEILEALNYIKTKEDELIKSFQILSKYA